MSPRAAWRLETLGFTRVYYYAAGKADWAAYGLPVEGEVTKSARLKDIARTDVPTCSLDDTVLIARRRAGDGETNARVGDVMRPGTSTFRPNVSTREMLDYMDRREHETSLVTTPDGRLVGLVLREDLERAATPTS